MPGTPPAGPSMTQLPRILPPPAHLWLCDNPLTMPWCPWKSSASIEAHTLLVPFLEHSLLYFSVSPLQRPPLTTQPKVGFSMTLHSFFKSSHYNSELRFVSKFILHHLSWHTCKPPWYKFSFEWPLPDIK